MVSSGVGARLKQGSKPSDRIVEESQSNTDAARPPLLPQKGGVNPEWQETL